ncbi:MAG: MBL fold metallo-hydrolase [Gammaproteobacteria bacterium SHHR-1]|uniref:MBL fold metallo-hydrolase n=1 Tax=Magnetovirga frankeli TaxID=947516 RepID=UPI0012934ED1|nr:MBL fold metallo-hydrolase [gamma proteobacterium SS-5]
MNYRVIPVTSYAQNASLISCPSSKRAAVIDPGGDIQRIIRLAEQDGLHLEKILITHGHFDHCGAALDLAEQLAIPIEGPHPDDEFLLRSLPEWAAMAGFPPTRSFSPQRWLMQGDRVSVGNIELQVLHCPGHTPGHIVFYQPDSALAFVGDVLFQGSIGRTDFPRGNQAELLRSIKQRLFPLGDEVRFVPGHGAESSIGEERRHNPFLN